MKRMIGAAVACLGSVAACAGDVISLETAPPVVVQTSPMSGSQNVNPALPELRVVFSKPMQDGSWSWVDAGNETFPQMTGDPAYAEDGKTCVLPVRLEPNKFYALWLNSERYQNFKDQSGRPAVPYLISFTTGEQSSAAPETTERRFTERLVPVRIRTNGPASTNETGARDLRIAARIPAARAALQQRAEALLNENQRDVIAWTDRQFRSYFDRRTFDDMGSEERAALETSLTDRLQGPENREYYEAINTLGALRTERGVAALRKIAFSRLDKNNRDRWMAVRALGAAGDTAAVPQMIHLVYHGNVNTRWWAQISLVRLTGQNFENNWEAWGAWWNATGGKPLFEPEVIRWWEGQAEPGELMAQLAEGDRKFLESIRQAPGSAAQ